MTNLVHPTIDMTRNAQKPQNEKIWNIIEQRQKEIELKKKELTQTNEANVSICKHEHGNIITNYSAGRRVCGKCGIVVEKTIISQEAEWRNLKSNSQYSSDPVRCAVINPLLPNSSLSTKIVTKGKETSYLARLNRWQSMPHSERSLYEVFQELDRKGRKNDISGSVLTSAKQFYLRVYQKNAKLLLEGKKREGLRGGKRQGLIAACLFYACKQNNVPRSQTQIAEILEYKKSDVTRGSNIFLNLIKHDDLSRNINDLINGHHFVRHYGMTLKVSHEVIRCSVYAYDYIKKLRILSASTAPSIASGCLFLVLTCLYPNIHESVVAKTCGISKVTILNVYKQLAPYKFQILSYIFAKDITNSLQIFNEFTIRKIKRITKHVSLTPDFHKFHPQLLAATIVFYVIFKSNREELPDEFSETFWLKIHPWKEKDLVECGCILVRYSEHINKLYLDEVIVPPNLCLPPPKTCNRPDGRGILKRKRIDAADNCETKRVKSTNTAQNHQKNSDNKDNIKKSIQK